MGSDPAVLATIGARMAAGVGFEIARGALGSSVQRRDCSVYELDERELGQFDVVYLGSLLVHLRDPVLALERLRAVCAGTLVVVDGIDLATSLRNPRTPLARLDACGRPWWWQPNPAALARMVQAGGFELISAPRRVFVPPGRGWQPRRWAPRGLRSRPGRDALIAAWLGDPHAALLARPRR